MSAITAVVYYLFVLFFSIVIFVLWLRIALRFNRVSALNPVSQNIYLITNSLVHPIDNLLPANIKSNRYDWASFIVLIFVEIIKFFLVVLLAYKQIIPFAMLLLYTIADLIIEPCNLLFYAIIIRVILSWINPLWRNPFIEVIYLVTEPILRPARRLIPPISGLDFSPLVILIVLKAVTIFVLNLLPIKELL